MEQRKDHETIFVPTRPTDGAAMRLLAYNAYHGYIDRIGRKPAPMTTDYNEIAARSDVLLVWRENDLVGMLVTRLEEHHLFIDNIAVAPEMQGVGLGSQLLAEAERIARRNGRGEIRLYTNEVMIENLTFYESRGYLETGRRVESGYNRVYFTKRVGSAP
jgi:ribosomal protein S18 acetylase RimI-like enzyme